MEASASKGSLGDTPAPQDDSSRPVCIRKHCVRSSAVSECRHDSVVGRKGRKPGVGQK